MICRSHNELRARSNLTELADNEFVTILLVVKKYIISFKACRINRIIIISVVPNRNIRGFDHILDEARCFVFVWKDHIRFGILFMIL